MIYPPNQKPPIWSIDPGIVAYNCRKHGFPHPVLAMPMWERAGNRALDYSGHGNHGILIDGAGWDADGIVLDGINDHVNCGNDSSLDITGKITIAARIYPTANDNWDYIVAKRDADTCAYIFGLDDGYLFMGGGDTSYLNWVMSTTTTLLNNWYDVTGIIDGTTGKLYIDGELDTTDSSITAISSQSDVRVVLGVRWDTYPNISYPFSGTINNPMIFNTVLTESQIKFLYENPYFMYQIPEELYGYIAEVPPVIFTPRIIMF